MTDVRRYYKCGCCPDDEEFCKVGDFLVWTGRDAATAYGIEDYVEEERAELYRRLDAASHLLMGHHLSQRDYVDVGLDAPEMQEPDDGYDGEAS